VKTDDELIERLRRASLMVRPLEAPLEGVHIRSKAKRNRQRVMAMTVALIVAAGIVAVAMAAVVGLRGHGRGPASGGSSLDPAVARSLELRPGRYFFLREIVVSGGDGSLTDQRTWWATDGSGEVRFHTNQPEKYVPFPPVGVYGEGRFPLPYRNDLSKLSTDPRILVEQLRERSGEEGGKPATEFAEDGLDLSPTGRTWRAIRRLFEYPNASPLLRAALFDVAAGLRGVTREDGVRDPFGRAAIALELRNDGEGSHWLLYFDPTTHQPMSESEAWGNHAPEPIVVFESAIVGSRGAAPQGHELLFPVPDHEPTPPPEPSSSLP
jgi:hypothetical protein